MCLDIGVGRCVDVYADVCMGMCAGKLGQVGRGMGMIGHSHSHASMQTGVRTNLLDCSFQNTIYGKYYLWMKAKTVVGHHRPMKHEAAGAAACRMVLTCVQTPHSFTTFGYRHIPTPMAVIAIGTAKSIL